jgi:hypothetical protein
MLVVSCGAEGEADEVTARQPGAEGSGHALLSCQDLLRRIRDPNLGPVCALANRPITMHQAASLGADPNFDRTNANGLFLSVCVGLLWRFL